LKTIDHFARRKSARDVARRKYVKTPPPPVSAAQTLNYCS